MLLEVRGDALVSGGFVIPAAGFGVGLRGADVVELCADGGDGRWVWDEEVAGRPGTGEWR